MEHAPITAGDALPVVAPGGVTAGLDWATDDHAVAVVDASGTAVNRFAVEHNAAGVAELVAGLRRAGAVEVAIERPHGRVVDTLPAAGFTVVVISPNQMKNLRSRYRQTGGKDDRFDAFVLADTLRTDRARLRRLVPDTPATTVLRAGCRARKDLVKHRVALAHQLREHLRQFYPGPVGLFTDLDGVTSLTFLARFDCQERADWLSAKRLGAWLGGVGYTGRTDAAVMYAQLTAAPRGAVGAAATAAAQVTRAFVAALRAIVEQIRALERQIVAQLGGHPDAPIFTSLPRAGRVRAARLLSEVGDCRARFPTPESLACLAGVAPSTRRSGKVTIISFRWSADKQLRDALCDFAGDSRHANRWAAALYAAAIARGHDHPHAVRVLARAWVYVIWRCWQDGIFYDPGKHRALQSLLGDQPLQAA